MGSLQLEPGKNAVEFLSGGEKIVAHLFLPEDFAGGHERPAIVVTPPNTGIKEQTAGLYAKKLSEKGFITLAFDPRGFGESEGHASLCSPYRGAEDIRSAISYMVTLEEVDASNIFNLGMCAGSGWAGYATAFDSRVKALVMVSPSLTTMDESLAAFNLGSVADVRSTFMQQVAAARQKYFETGEVVMMSPLPETEEALAAVDPFTRACAKYYLFGGPGDVPNYRNEMSLMSWEDILGFSIFDYTRVLEPVPLYMVYGDKAASAPGAKRFYDALESGKEHLVIDGAGHFDLYWRPEYVEPAVDGIAGFLQKHV